MTVIGVTDKLMCTELELFTAWLAQKPIAELSSMSGLEPTEVMFLAQKHRWLEHMASLPLDRQISGQPDAIKVNRTKNLMLFEKLRNHLNTMLDDLNAGTLTFDKPLKSKEGIDVVQVKPTTGDIVNIANALKTITEGTAKCLGDVMSLSAPRSAGMAQSAAQEIVVNLPAVLGPGTSPPVDLLAQVMSTPEKSPAD